MVTAANLYNTLCARIIEQQEFIVGSLAWEIAVKVQGLAIGDRKTYAVSIDSDPKKAINELVLKYEKVFGLFAHNVCKQAVSDMLADMPLEDIPEGLR